MPLISQPTTDIEHPINCLEWVFSVPENPNPMIQNGLVYAVFSASGGRRTEWMTVPRHGTIPIRLTREFFANELSTSVYIRDFVAPIGANGQPDTGFHDRFWIVYREIAIDGCDTTEISSSITDPIIVLNSYNSWHTAVFSNRGILEIGYPLTLRPSRYQVGSRQDDLLWSIHPSISIEFYDCEGTAISNTTLTATPSDGYFAFIYPVGPNNIPGFPQNAVRYVINDTDRTYDVSICDHCYKMKDSYQLMILEPQGGYVIIPACLAEVGSRTETQTYMVGGECKSSFAVSDTGRKVFRKGTDGLWTFETKVDHIDAETGFFYQQLSSSPRAFIIWETDGVRRLREFIIDSGMSGFNVSRGTNVISGYLADEFVNKGWK